MPICGMTAPSASCVLPDWLGQGRGLVLPMLLPRTSPAVVRDAKGENWADQGGMAVAIVPLLPVDTTNPKGARFDPLLEMCNGPSEVRDVHSIANILGDPASGVPVTQSLG